MGQALYRKYRSKSLDEIVGQEHITDTLHKALGSGRISHAYLFTGPRGVGKTSIARILAHELNQAPYDEEQAHIDIIEIDAASNNGVEDVRDLREKIHVAPAQGKYKVYIIDEVHMLSKAAFNALLKTLEEPPAHVVFILATTEAHKLPETIISRTQRYIFRPIDTQKAVDHLRYIAEQENIKISDAALELVVRHGDGSFRDSISLLDQVSNRDGLIELSVIETVLGIPPAQTIDDLLTALRDHELHRIVSLLDNACNCGFRAVSLAQQLGTAVRQQVLAGHHAVAAPIELLGRLLEVGTSPDPERYLEIVLLDAASAGAPTAQPVTQVAAPAETVIAATPPPKPVEPATPLPDSSQITITAPAKSAPAKPPTIAAPLPTPAKAVAVAPAGQLDSTTWNAILDVLKKQYNTLYGIVRMAEPDFSQPNSLGLAFAFAFHQKRVSEAKNQKIISDAVTEVTGKPVTIICKLDPELKLAKNPVAVPANLPDIPVAAGEDKSLTTISNIFGGGELLQS